MKPIRYTDVHAVVIPRALAGTLIPAPENGVARMSREAEFQAVPLRNAMYEAERVASARALWS